MLEKCKLRPRLFKKILTERCVGVLLPHLSRAQHSRPALCLWDGPLKKCEGGGGFSDCMGFVPVVCLCKEFYFSFFFVRMSALPPHHFSDGPSLSCFCKLEVMTNRP
jgi:hypothetical protein